MATLLQRHIPGPGRVRPARIRLALPLAAVPSGAGGRPLAAKSARSRGTRETCITSPFRATVRELRRPAAIARPAFGRSVRPSGVRLLGAYQRGELGRFFPRPDAVGDRQRRSHDQDLGRGHRQRTIHLERTQAAKSCAYFSRQVESGWFRATISGVLKLWDLATRRRNQIRRPHTADESRASPGPTKGTFWPPSVMTRRFAFGVCRIWICTTNVMPKEPIRRRSIATRQ